MATLVLTVVGGAVGGPIGAALGAAIGGAVDRTVLFKPKGREGPRLTELAVQTSSYGSPIAKVFGTMRVAGSVIWSTDLIEHSSTSGGGKRGPETVSYGYSASFAVLLSGRGIVSVGRIWADGKLLRGEAGDMKSGGVLRLHLGGEDQPVDPLIASAEGVTATPAHRGCAYAVIEGLPLADFGNRIPSLSFEVIADPVPVSVGAVVAEVSDGLIAGDEAGTVLGGYSAYGDNLRAVVDGLASAAGAWFANDGAALALRAGDGTMVDLTDAGAAAKGSGTRGKRAIASADSAPRSVSIGYYDGARDYQTGLQRADRPGAGSRNNRIELPAVLDAGAAKGIAGAMLARADLERERRTLALDWRTIAVSPGDRVTIAGEPGRWRVTRWSLEKMVLSLELLRIARVGAPASATAGRVAGAIDALAGTTIVHAFEIPPFDDAVLTAPRLTIAAAGTGTGWRRASLSLSLDGGLSWAVAGTARAAATLGQIAVPPARAPSTLVDRAGATEVLLANDAMTLADADDAALDRGVNLALVGDELLQFGRAERIGPARWRLSALWRGRRGSEWAAGLAGVGDRFVLLDPATLTTTVLPASAIGSEVRVMAAGIGDGSSPPIAAVIATGDSVLPPSPAHLRVRADGAGATLDWVRRSRTGWRWLDGVDSPLAEEREHYRYALVTSGTARRGTDVFAPEAAIVTMPLGFAGRIEVTQIGSFGSSRPIARDWPL